MQKQMQKSPPSALCGTILLLPFQSDKQTSKQALRPCKDSETWQVQIRIMPGFWSFPFSIFVELSTIHDCVQDVLWTKAKTPTVPSNVCAPTFHPRWFSGARHAETQKCAGRCRKTLDISALWPKDAETIYMPCQLLYNDIACILTRLALKHSRVLLVKRCQSELVWRPGVVLSKCYVLVGVHRPWNHGGWQNDWQGAIRWIQ